MNHSFDIAHAKEYGLPEGILINNFQFWIAKNRANGRHQHEGRTWTYNTAKALAELLPARQRAASPRPATPRSASPRSLSPRSAADSRGRSPKPPSRRQPSGSGDSGGNTAL